MAPVLPLAETSENPYLLLVLDSWRLIAVATLIAVVATYILTKTVMTKWYRATAVIEPVPEGAVENRVEGGLGGFAGGGMSSFHDLRYGFPSPRVPDDLPQLHVQHGVALRHNLTNDLLRDDDEKPKTERKLKMKLFDILKGRFKVDYSIQAHNLSVHFIDRDPVRAQQIVQYYLDDLRELQRREAIRDASDAILSLRKRQKRLAIRCSGKAYMLWSPDSCSVRNWLKWRLTSRLRYLNRQSHRTSRIRRAQS